MAPSGRDRRFLLLVGSIVVAALIVVAAIAILPPHPGSVSTSSSQASATSTPSISATDLVQASFGDHMRLLAARDVSAMVGQYEGNANVTWLGNAAGLTGEYDGAFNINLLLGSSFFGPRSTSLSIGNLTQRILAVSSQSALVNSSFMFAGESTIVGNFSGAVSAEDFYAYSAATGEWQISQEVWNFVSFNVQYPRGNIPCTGPSCPQGVQDMAFSGDGTYLAAGTYGNSGYGSVYLVSTQGQTPSVVWRSVATNTVIWSVAITADGSYIAAAGFAHPGDKHGNGRVYLFDREGALLWNVSAGSEPRAVWVAIASDGSRVAADYGSGIIYLDTAGQVLWNQTFPQGGISFSFAMSSDARFIAYADENVTLQGGAGSGWGVFYLDSQGRQLWSYTEDHAGGDSFVQMSSDGSHVAASSQRFYNGSVYYIDGRNGSLLWAYPIFPNTGIANYNSLVMSPDGSYVASGGPSSGVLVFEQSGKILWEGQVGGFGEPALILEKESLVLLYQPSGNEFDLVRFNGTVVASSSINAVSAFAGSPSGSIWVAAGGGISVAGSCAPLDFYDGPMALPSTQLCW